MNVYDSERMADVLRPLGYGMTDAPEDADLVVLNTCHIREKATEKVYSELGQLQADARGARPRRRGGMTIAVAGCVAQAEGEEIMRRQPAVDLVVGPAGLSPAARADRPRRAGPAASAWPPTSPPRRSSTPCPPTRAADRRHRLPDGAGGLRQVLHLLRRALHPRRRVVAAGRRRSLAEARAPGRPGRARGHPAGPERQRL